MDQNVVAKKKSFKEQCEEHPVIYLATVALIAFGSGFGISQKYFQAPSKERVITRTASCKVEGLDVLEAGHRARVEMLQKQLVKAEAQAVNYSLISSYQEIGEKSAERIRGDIREENSNYQAAVEKLNKACS
tara:strand:- start:8108 stop:8503 length:396 start_codon:yes stop_codon:yes gene_type:complete